MKMARGRLPRGDHGWKVNSLRGGQVVCVRGNSGCHQERGKPRDAERNETRLLAVEVQERQDKGFSEKQGEGRRLSSTEVREQQHSIVR